MPATARYAFAARLLLLGAAGVGGLHHTLSVRNGCTVQVMRMAEMLVAMPIRPQNLAVLRNRASKTPASPHSELAVAVAESWRSRTPVP